MHMKMIALTLLSLGLGAGLACAADGLRPEVKTSTQVSNSLPANFNPSQSLAPLVDALQPAVVFVTVQQTVEHGSGGWPQEMAPFFGPFFQTPEMPRSREGQGSGFIISADGYILTNSHVVEQANKLTVKLSDDTEYEAKVIGTDLRTDIGLLKVEAGRDLPFVRLGDSDQLRVGDWVMAIGNPFGLSHTVTAGIVSAKGRFIGAGPYDDFIQTDASINPGNSGGPLFNLSGEVVGINTAIVRQGQGIGFAVPSNMVKEVFDELKDTGRVQRGWIGVGLQKLDADLAAALGSDTREGAVVIAVYTGTPGAKAGLQKGDIIAKIDDRPVKDNEELVRSIGAHKPGESVKLEILREGKAKTLKVELSERPDEKDLNRGIYKAPKGEGKEGGSQGGEKADALSGIGISLERFDGRLQGKLRHGLMVTKVDSDGPAADRLERGDLILEVNRKEVHTVSEAEQVLSKSSKLVLFLVERDGSEEFVTIKVP